MPAPGPVLWLMGPTSSGKTTLGEALVARLRDKGRPAIFFDGDEVRRLIGPGQGFSPDDRLKRCAPWCIWPTRLPTPA